MKKVTIIVISFRSAETICDTLDSIKNQDYGNIELIVTDDCSDDDTIQAVNGWIENLENTDMFSVELITSKMNTGLPANINRALKIATGEYVKILAADDLLLPDAISEYVKFMENNDNMLPIARVKLFCEENEDKKFPAVEKYCQKCYEIAQKSYKNQYRSLLIKNWIVAPAASFYPIKILRELGNYDEGYRWFEDYPMNLKLMHKGYSFGFVDKEIVKYRMSASSVTASSQNRLKKAELKLFIKLRFWYMISAGMGWEAIKQCKYWLKIAFMPKQK